MSSYLEAYGAAEQKHARNLHILKNVSIVVACLLVIGLILYSIFQNYFQERTAKTFVALLASHDYAAAYKLWGCTDSHPCTEYPFTKFMDDWGPKSAHANQASAHIGLSQRCGSGVVIRIDYQGSEEAVPLWVERESGTISFAPYAECPGRHLHLGAWFKSLFGG